MVRARMFSELARGRAALRGAATERAGPFLRKAICALQHIPPTTTLRTPRFTFFTTAPNHSLIMCVQNFSRVERRQRSRFAPRSPALSSASTPLIRRSGCPKKNSKGEPCQSRSGEECPYHGAEHSKLCGAITTSGKKCKVGAAPPDARARTWRRARHSSPAAAAAAAPAQVPADQKHHKGGHCRLHRDSA